jgi:hypothetical protein
MKEHERQNPSQLDDVELLVRLDSADKAKDGRYVRSLLDGAKNRGLLIWFSLHSKSSVARLQFALGRLPHERLPAILESVTQPEHVSKLGLQGAVLEEVDRRKTDEQITDAARKRAKTVPFNGDIHFVKELMERLQSRANETIPDEHRRVVAIMLVKTLTEEKPEDTTAEKLVTALPTWIVMAKDVADDAWQPTPKNSFEGQ